MNSKKLLSLTMAALFTAMLFLIPTAVQAQETATDTNPSTLTQSAPTDDQAPPVVQRSTWGAIKVLYRGNSEQAPDVSQNGLQKPGVEPAYISNYVMYPINPWLPLNAISFGTYTSRGYHLGDDCRRDPGTPVYAIYGGNVMYVGYHSGSGNWGWIAIVESNLNGFRFCTVYGHLSGRNHISQGMCIPTGAKIGEVGYSWENGGHVPHLHLGIHYGGFGASYGTYPSWCRGYANTPSGWYDPTFFIANY